MGGGSPLNEGGSEFEKHSGISWGAQKTRTGERIGVNRGVPLEKKKEKRKGRVKSFGQSQKRRRTPGGILVQIQQNPHRGWEKNGYEDCGRLTGTMQGKKKKKKFKKGITANKKPEAFPR